ncbi:MAG: tetratricopeptide repeat protein [Elusimicrobiota bacterium]
MKAESLIESGRECLKVKDFHQALREFKKAVKEDEKNTLAYEYLARVYLKLGEKEKKGFFFQLAEESIRKAIKLEPYTPEFHNILINIKTKTGTLDELSREYRRKKESNSNKIYETLLEKIKAVGVISIPDNVPEKPVKSNILLFLNYIIMPLVTAVGVIAWFHPYLESLKLPILIVIMGYILARILSKPKIKKDKW